MKELYFVNSWPDIKKAWSGTPNSLYNALSKQIKVRKIDGGKKRSKIGNVIDLLTMGMNSANFTKGIINNTTILSDIPLLVFGEYLTCHVEKTYCYQDLSVDYLLRLRVNNNPQANYAMKKVIPTFILERKRSIAKQFYHKCAGVFTMSEWLRNDLIENTGIQGEKVHHVGGGCNIDVSKINYSKKQGNRFLFVGRDWDRKNGALVVEAFKKMYDLYSEFNSKLYIAGPYEKPECIGSDENIIFLGRLSYDELVEYYNLCDYYVMPSKYEAYGLVFAEALCFGLPCIGKNICAMPEFIRENQNGILIENDNVDELTSAMSKMLLEGHEMACYVQEHREYYINKYSWDSVAQRIVRVLCRDGYFDLNE